MKLLTEFLSRLDITSLQRSLILSYYRPRSQTKYCANPVTKQLFPGYSYSNTSAFEGRCFLTGIPLSNGRHLGNLGSLIALQFQWMSLTSTSRFNYALWNSNCGVRISVVEIRAKTSSCGTKVYLIASLNLCACTDFRIEKCNSSSLGI